MTGGQPPLHGRVAVVTGASSGIGEAAARALAAEGMTVVAVARRADRLAALAARTPGVLPRASDVTDDADVRALADWVADRLGACHLLVNNAGAAFRRPFRGPGHVGDVRAAMDVNFLGTVRCMAAFADLLRASAPSRVINIGSIAGKVGAGAPAYSASKFATVGFTEAVAMDWRRDGVDVCQLNPGYVQTEGFPQDKWAGSRLTRRLVAEPPTVADAIVRVARRGGRERTVPGWYRLFVVARHVAAPAFWAGVRRVAR